MPTKLHRLWEQGKQGFPTLTAAERQRGQPRASSECSSRPGSAHVAWPRTRPAFSSQPLTGRRNPWAGRDRLCEWPRGPVPSLCFQQGHTRATATNPRWPTSARLIPGAPRPTRISSLTSPKQPPGAGLPPSSVSLAPHPIACPASRVPTRSVWAPTPCLSRHRLRLARPQGRCPRL